MFVEVRRDGERLLARVLQNRAVEPDTCRLKAGVHHLQSVDAQGRDLVQSFERLRLTEGFGVSMRSVGGRHEPIAKPIATRLRVDIHVPNTHET